MEGRRRIEGRHGMRYVFEDGFSEPFDLLIDASGARSTLSPLVSRALPYGALWGVVDWPAATSLPFDELSQRYRRANRMIGVLPIGYVDGSPAPKAAVFWSLPRDGQAAWLAVGLSDWKAGARQLWPEVLG
jgi:2-polyprenyl-6-methoxyphenol hydroxylase-like FAD-dependent oxidoreductase